MKFRPYLIFLLVIVTAVCTWGALCTWKVIRLENEERKAHGGDIERAELESLLQQKYGKPGQPVWNVPLWGPVHYEDVKKNALSLGTDIVGGRSYSSGS